MMWCSHPAPAVFLAVTVALLPAHTDAVGCPAPDHLPLHLTSPSPSSQRQVELCAVVYEERATVPSRSCGGRRREVAGGERRATLHAHWDNEVSAVVTRPGCRFTGYRDPGFSGERRVLRGQTYCLWALGFDNSVSSYACECEGGVRREATNTSSTLQPPHTMTTEDDVFHLGVDG